MRIISTFIGLSLLLSLAGCQPQPPEAPSTATPPVSATPAPDEAPLEAPSPNFLPNVREGFVVQKWAEVPSARSLAVSPDGKYVFVGSRAGWVHKVTVGAGPPRVEMFLKNLEGSNGVCFAGGDLYVGERLKIVRYKASDDFQAEKGEVILDGLPDETHHGWRYIKEGPDQRIRMGIGAPCNVCLRDDPRFATIVSFTREGKDFQIEAKGVRNSVGFDWHPETGVFYFTDNGRDHLGDNKPPCELNRMTEEMQGSHFGFPYVWGDNQPDPEFGSKAPEGLDFVKPYTKFQAHVAPLGCYFPKGENLRKLFGDEVIVAQHGSWNRTVPIGYRVVTVDTAKPEADPQPFLWGFQDESNKSRIYGRPVDIAELPDGTILVSDDHRGVVWSVRAKQ